MEVVVGDIVVVIVVDIVLNQVLPLNVPAIIVEVQVTFRMSVLLQAVLLPARETGVARARPTLPTRKTRECYLFLSIFICVNQIFNNKRIAE